MSEAYPRTQKTCKRCGATFRVKPSHWEKRVYCSQDCMAAEYRTRLIGASNPNYRGVGQHACAHCGAPCTSYNPAARHFCSPGCVEADREARRIRPQRWVQRTFPYGKQRVVAPTGRICVGCRTVFFATRGQTRRCPDCLIVERPCVVCGIAFKTRPYSGTRTCGRVCARRYITNRQQGANSHFWQGGKTAQMILRRTHADYKAWRVAVFARDNFTCQMCGKRGRLAAHHIKTVRDFPDLLLDERNGIALCWPCHRGIKGKEAQYEAQFAVITGLEVPR